MTDRYLDQLPKQRTAVPRTYGQFQGIATTAQLTALTGIATDTLSLNPETPTGAPRISCDHVAGCQASLARSL